MRLLDPLAESAYPLNSSGMMESGRLDHATHQSLFYSEPIDDHRLQEYAIHLKLLESQNKQRLLLAQQEQINQGRPQIYGQTIDEEIAARQRQEREQ